MTAIDHLAVPRDDGTALAVAAGQGLDAAVPACDGWTVADLVLHTGMVHRHKLAHRPDQTAGFWRRRTAQETVVHRVDAERAHGRAGPVPAALAAETGDRWQVRLLATGIEVGPGQTTADASAAGGAADLLLWLWGRGPADPLGRTGDPALVPRVRELAAEATQ